MALSARDLTLFTLAHAAVDGVCAAVLWHAVVAGLVSSTVAWVAFIAYNVLAFAVQPLVGLVVDRPGLARVGAVAGAVATAASAAVAVLPGGFAPAVALGGLGNAVFHVSGGVFALRMVPGRATCAGIYVSSGAAGLALGIAVGKADLAVWPLAVALCALAVAIALTTARKATPGGVTPGPAPTCSVRPVERRVQTLAWPAGGDSLVLLLLLAVAVRSYVGLALVLPWKHDPWLLAAFTSAIVAGKAGGGLTADVFGWRRIGLAGLLGSAPLLAMAGTSPVAGIVGIALFNTTMPITLAAVARLLPGHEGFAFGLTCLALFAGAAPVLTGWAPPLTMPAIAVLTAVAAAALWLGLRPWSPPTPAPTGGVALLPATITRGGQR